MDRSNLTQGSRDANYICNEKGAQRRHKHSTLAVVRQSQKFCPTADPHPGGVGQPKFNQLEMVTTFAYKPSLARVNACNFELLW